MTNPDRCCHCGEDLEPNWSYGAYCITCWKVHVRDIEYTDHLKEIQRLDEDTR